MYPSNSGNPADDNQEIASPYHRILVVSSLLLLFSLRFSFYHNLFNLAITTTLLILYYFHHLYLLNHYFFYHHNHLHHHHHHHHHHHVHHHHQQQQQQHSHYHITIAWLNIFLTMNITVFILIHYQRFHVVHRYNPHFHHNHI